MIFFMFCSIPSTDSWIKINILSLSLSVNGLWSFPFQGLQQYGKNINIKVIKDKKCQDANGRSLLLWPEDNFIGRWLYTQNIFLLPFPDDIVWRQPFIPSFLVPYDRTRDFYFSGHTGIAIIITLQVFKLKLPFWVKSYCFVMLGWLMTMLIASRVHYSIDIIGGVIFAVLCFDVA